MRNKKSIAVLLGDPSGIGPELISKILSHNILKKININLKIPIIISLLPLS